MGIILVRQLKEVIAKWLKQSKKLAFYILPFISLISQISCAYVLEEVLNFNLMGDICEINWELDSEMSKVIAPHDYLNQGYFVNMTNWFKISLFVPFMIQGIIFYHEVGDGCFNNIIIYFVFQTFALNRNTKALTNMKIVMTISTDLTQGYASNIW